MSPRQSRWALFFARFDVRVTFRPGSENRRADALSRMYDKTEEKVEPTHFFPPEHVLLTIDAPLTGFLKEVRDSYPPNFRQICPKLNIIPSDGLWFYRGRLILPNPDLWEEVTNWCHVLPMAGHQGVERTRDLVSRYVWWPTMQQDIVEYVDRCATCISMKAIHTKPQGLLKPLDVPRTPWTQISMDFITDLPPSAGFKNVWVIKDHFSKMIHLVPLRALPSSRRLVPLFLWHVVRLHGIPQIIVSDRGPQYASHFWKALMKALGVDLRLSTAFHPQTDGATERVNSDLEQYLRCFCAKDPTKWSSFLPLAEFALNNAKSSGSGVSPFFALYGIHPAVWPGHINPQGVPEDVLSCFRAHKARWSFIQAKLLLNRARMKAQADRHRTESPVYDVGDSVWLSTQNIHLPGSSKKFKPRFIGPFPVSAKISDMAYKLTLPATLHVHPVFHVSLLRLASSRPVRACRNRVAVLSSAISPHLVGPSRGGGYPVTLCAHGRKRVTGGYALPLPQCTRVAVWRKKSACRARGGRLKAPRSRSLYPGFRRPRNVRRGHANPEVTKLKASRELQYNA